jgi:biofilm PGA synthesis N-glycosyltransferase PgaC
MIEAVIIFFIVYVVSVGVVVLGGYILHSSKAKENHEGPTIKPSEITVLIPFRNEEKRVNVLLESIQKLNSFPHEIIFINDHSDDNGAALIKSALGDLHYQILDVPDNLSGKKEALRYVIERCKTAYILTWDADIYFQPSYFDHLAELSDADMYLLPVILKAEKPVEYLYELDVVLANAINVGLSGLSRPIIASGANLLYKREVFNAVDDLGSHSHMASGDDTYLLRDFRKNKKDVRVISSLKCAVYTETPRSFREFIDQRLRWILMIL